MRRVAPLLFLAALVAAAPAVADAQQGDRDRGGRGDGSWQRESGRGGGGGGDGRWQRGGDNGGGWRGGDNGRRNLADDDRRGGGRGDGGNPGGGDGARGQNSLREGWREQQNEARAGVREGRFVPLGGVLSELRRRQPGRQLDAGIEDRGGRPTYRVRWAAENGKRMDFIVDARTGAVLSVEGQ